MNKKISIGLRLVIIAAVIYFAVINFNNASVVNFIVSPGSSIASNTALVAVCVFILGVLTGAADAVINKGAMLSQIRFYAGKNEKLAQQNEIDADEKEALKRKIASLEIALEEALMKKDFQ